MIHHDAATRRIFAAVAEHFTTAQMKTLACLLGLQAAGSPIRETDRQIGQALGIHAGNVRKHLIVLKTKVIPGRTSPVVEVLRGGEKGRKKRRIIVRLVGPIPTPARQSALSFESEDGALGLSPRAFASRPPAGGGS